MSAGVLHLLDRGVELLEHEKRLLVGGDLGGLDDLAADKARLLEEIEFAVPGDDPPEEIQRGFARVLAAARRNETLLQAAREGVAAARRRIGALYATRRGAVAYDREGAPIQSRSDTWGKTRCA